ncbi:hypothetical protein EVG20_g11204, partial [Dentipellis fragilis]
MATDFWASSHYKRWIVDRATLKQARADDLQYVDDPEQLEFLNIYFANLISKLGKLLSFRQRAIATATVFFRRFYIKNSYCETDPYIVIAACCYVAAKAEESPVHIKNVVSESRTLFSLTAEEGYGIKHFPSDNSKLAEMEFYLVDDLECDLTGSGSSAGAEAGELGTGIGADDGPRYWGTGEGKLELGEGPLQMAWLIINDTYRSELCLLYPPHLIAIAAIYLTLVFNGDMRAALQQPPAAAQPQRRSSRTHASTKKPPPDAVGFLAGLNVSLPVIATLAQEIIALYALCERYREDSVAEGGTWGRGRREDSAGRDADAVTPGAMTRLVMKMRKERLEDMMHPPSGRPMAVNRMLERTHAAGCRMPDVSISGDAHAMYMNDPIVSSPVFSIAYRPALRVSVFPPYTTFLIHPRTPTATTRPGGPRRTHHASSCLPSSRVSGHRWHRNR